jgi:sortase A
MRRVSKSPDHNTEVIGRFCQRPERWWSAWRWTERAIFTAGLSLLAIYCAFRLDSYLGSRAALESLALESSVPAATDSRAEGHASPAGVSLPAEAGSLPEVDMSAWDKERVRAYKKSLSSQTGAPIAVLQIPRIHLTVPLLDGTDDLTLNHAAGRIAGTAGPGEQGNIGIAGHRDGFFRGLKDVRLGDAIELRTSKGTDKYVVDQIRIVTPDDVSVLRPRPAPSLTLVTCYPFYFIGSAPRRYIVMASLTHETSSEPVSSTPGSEVQPSSNNKEKK